MAICICIICWVLFCIFEGRFEAILWHLWARKPLFGFNPHKTKLLIFRRASVVIAASMIDPFLLIGHILVFSFVHNGSMYSYRNDIDPDVYEDRWQSEPSSESISMFNLTYNARFILFLLGILTYVLCLLT